MSAFCGKYPECGCVGIGTKCYSEKTWTELGEKPPVFPDWNNEKLQNLKVDIIPRNKPCPCGSGKRYKHCCAK
ncbi:MAG: SEC-C metal-binding domain-containing protein [Ginsengibacter sp.]